MTTDFRLAARKSLRSAVAAVEKPSVALVIRRITIAVLAAALVGAVVVLPAAANNGPHAVAAKKKAKKCKKKKAKKRKCKHGGGGTSGGGLPGQATPAKPTPPDQPDSPDPPAALHVSSLTVDSNTVSGGSSTTGHVVIDAVAPSGGQVVDLSSSASRASVPVSVLVPSGQTSATFQVTTAGGDPGSATLTASIGTSTATTDLTVVALNVSHLSVTPNPVFAGNSATGHVTLDDVAPSGGQVVDLDSTNSSVDVPGSVLVPTGDTTATFSVDTTPGTAATATLTASIGASSQTTELSVVDTASLSSVQLAPHCPAVGSPMSNHVNLDVPAPEDTVIQLRSSDPALVVPSTVTVPAGASSAVFPATAVSAIDDVTVTATLDTTAVTDSVRISETTPDPSSATMDLDPGIIDVGDTSMGTLTLDCETSEDLVFTLAAAPVVLPNPTNVTVPPTVTIPAGKRSVTFTIGTGAASAADYTISATAGSFSDSKTLTVNGQPD